MVHCISHALPRFQVIRFLLFFRHSDDHITIKIVMSDYIVQMTKHSDIMVLNAKCCKWIPSTRQLLNVLNWFDIMILVYVSFFAS